MEAESPPHDLELSALEAEKEPMAPAVEEIGGGAPPFPPGGPDPAPAPPGGEKNGLVKIPTDEELGGSGAGGGDPEILGGCKFTGLGKEELLRAAGTPPWAKARAILLLLFWLGWLGMLGAAAAIVARAPRCRPLPPKTWWELGGLYRAPPRPFGGNLKGVEARLDHVTGLQMRGLVLGPLHPQSPGDPQNLPLDQLDPTLGTLQDFSQLLRTAKKKGLQVILDLTPNYLGGDAWMGQAVAGDPSFQQKVKRALSVWLERGVSGFFLDGIEELEPSVVAEWRNLTEQQDPPDGVPRVLMGGTRLRAPRALQALLNSSGAGLLLGPFLETLDPDTPGSEMAPQLLAFLHPQTTLAWSVGSPWKHLGGLSPPHTPQRLLLLWAALPGTPVLNYGDEVGLAEWPGPPEIPQVTPMPRDRIEALQEGNNSSELTPMPWDRIEALQEGDNSPEARLLDLCRRLGALRARERSLSLGEAEAIPAGPAAAFLRSWDQSERFLVVLNPGNQTLSEVALQDPRLPPQATLRLSTHQPVPQDPQVDLGALELLPYEGLLLSFPYTP